MNKQIEEMDEMLDIIAKARYEYANDITDHTENEYIREGLLNAEYRKQTEGDNEYKQLYEQLLEDFEHALHYAGKNNNVCNFCEHDCGENGVCKGKENQIECNPKWRGIVDEKGGTE